MDTSGTHLQTQKCMQNTSWERTGVPDQWKRMYRPTKTQEDEGAGGKTGVLAGLDLPSVGGGTEAGVPSPQRGNCLESEEKHLRLRVKQLICGSLNGMRIRQSLSQPYLPRMGSRVTWKVQQLGAGVWGAWRDPRVRAVRGGEGGDCDGKCLWRQKYKGL